MDHMGTYRICFYNEKNNLYEKKENHEEERSCTFSLDQMRNDKGEAGQPRFQRLSS